jgi:hypothetical protein
MPAFHTLIRQKQLLLASVFAVIVIAILGAVMWSLMLSDEPRHVAKTPTRTSEIASASTRIDPKEVWVEQIQNETKLLKQQVEALEKLMLENVKQVRPHSSLKCNSV